MPPPTLRCRSAGCGEAPRWPAPREQRVEAPRVERTACTVNKTDDAEGFGLRGVLTCQLLCPPPVLRGWVPRLDAGVDVIKVQKQYKCNKVEGMNQPSGVGALSGSWRVGVTAAGLAAIRERHVDLVCWRRALPPGAAPAHRLGAQGTLAGSHG